MARETSVGSIVNWPPGFRAAAMAVLMYFTNQYGRTTGASGSLALFPRPIESLVPLHLGIMAVADGRGKFSVRCGP